MGAVERRLLVNSQRHSGWMLPDSVQPFVFFFAFSEYFFVDAEENKRRVALVLVEWPLVKDPITWNGLSMTTAVRLTESISHLSFHWPTGTVLDVFPAAVVAPWNSSKTIDSFQHAVLTLSYRAWFSHHQVWIRSVHVTLELHFLSCLVASTFWRWRRFELDYSRFFVEIIAVWMACDESAEQKRLIESLPSSQPFVSHALHTLATHTRAAHELHTPARASSRAKRFRFPRFSTVISASLGLVCLLGNRDRSHNSVSLESSESCTRERIRWTATHLRRVKAKANQTANEIEFLLFSFPLTRRRSPYIRPPGTLYKGNPYR